MIELWYLKGDSYVKEVATIGLLEDLQNTNVVGIGVPEKLEAYLLPESRCWWQKVNDFWEHGNTISD